ncbi:hypothetical protein RLEG12_07730 (plasmid) [Rhizobium leguminosarum bv. trifolii CB782]|nr:hypothetical protein RLEG12_07730 [Rhizobium leguminosarum bv. trifolii CB782]
MYKYVSEAFVLLPYAGRVAEKLCARSSDYCRSILVAGADKVLDFGDARAILRPTNEGLYFRVEAQDNITFHGIRTLLQGSLSTIMTFQGDAVEWYPAALGGQDRKQIGFRRSSPATDH